MHIVGMIGFEPTHLTERFYRPPQLSNSDAYPKLFVDRPGIKPGPYTPNGCRTVVILSIELLGCRDSNSNELAQNQPYYHYITPQNRVERGNRTRSYIEYSLTTPTWNLDVPVLSLHYFYICLMGQIRTVVLPIPNRT